MHSLRPRTLAFASNHRMSAANATEAGMRCHIVQRDLAGTGHRCDSQHGSRFFCDDHVALRYPPRDILDRLVRQPFAENKLVSILISVAEVGDRPADDRTRLVRVLDLGSAYVHLCVRLELDKCNIALPPMPPRSFRRLTQHQRRSGRLPSDLAEHEHQCRFAECPFRQAS
jgi:hypothetical protein